MFESVLQDLGMRSAEIQERAEGAAFLKVARSAYPLAGVVYIALNIPTGPRRSRYMHCAYSDRWLKQGASHEPVGINRREHCVGIGGISDAGNANAEQSRDLGDEGFQTNEIKKTAAVGAVCRRCVGRMA